MKLESSLSDDRAGMLYTAPLIDVILLLIIFFLFGSNLVLRSGVEIRLPSSSSAIPSAEDAHIVTLIPNDTAEFYFNDERVDISKLEGKMEAALKRSRQVVVLSDESVDYGIVMGIAREFLDNGFEVAFATKTDTP